MGDIDVYRIGIGSDVHSWWVLRKHLPGKDRELIRHVRQSWNQLNYWGIWQAEHNLIPMNAARGLTKKSAKRRLERRI